MPVFKVSLGLLSCYAIYKALMFLKSTLIILLAMPAFAFADQALLEKLVALGVPARIERLLDFRDRSMDAEFVQDVYYCKGRAPTDSEACPRKDRIPTTRTIKVIPHDYLVYIDMKQPSIMRRMWVINLKDMTVESHLVAHGVRSGEGANATKFSNTPDSRQTSLGIYIVGPIYKMGGHGPSLRLYGVERSNDHAYLRDVVLHGARYAEQGFLARLKAKLGLKTERLGESWGCPAVDRKVAERLVPLLADGALLYIDHEDAMDEALTGNPVNVSKIVPLPRPRPESAPQEETAKTAQTAEQ